MIYLLPLECGMDHSFLYYLLTLKTDWSERSLALVCPRLSNQVLQQRDIQVILTGEENDDPDQLRQIIGHQVSPHLQVSSPLV